eukprot:GHVS01095516.1.p1 GENE.GHVS01095516.1~~GHVS01095516.1.p1  ORF type:complete len:516 (-),score=54.82 GHVS01095516.1:535-2082(-)
MGAGQSSWVINDIVIDPIDKILSSVYTRRPDIQQRVKSLTGKQEEHVGGEDEGANKQDGEEEADSVTEVYNNNVVGAADIFSQACLSVGILDNLIPFLMGPALVNCMECSSTWFAVIVEWVKIRCRSLDQQFEQFYGDILTIDKSTVKFEPVYVAEKALRMDWVVYAKVKPSCANKITQIGYSFSYVDGTTNRSCCAHSTSPTTSTVASGKHSADKDGAGSDRSTGSSGSDHRSNVSESTSIGEDAPLAQHPNVTTTSPTFNSRRSENGKKSSSSQGGTNKSSKAKTTASTSIVSPLNSSYEGGRGAPRGYQVNYQFNTFKKGTNRELWLHKDICRFHGDETKVAAMPSVGIVCVDDRIEVAVNLLNAFGLVQWDSIRWLPSQSVSLSYISPLNRMCPIEAIHKDWFDIDRFQTMTTERLRPPETFAPFLSHVQTSFAGVDIAVRRAEYKAVLHGCVGGKAERAWGMPCEVHPASNPVVCSLNRLGLQHDRGLSVQLRVGDSLIYYLSQGGANPS